MYVVFHAARMGFLPSHAWVEAPAPVQLLKITRARGLFFAGRSASSPGLAVTNVIGNGDILSKAAPHSSYPFKSQEYYKQFVILLTSQPHCINFPHAI